MLLPPSTLGIFLPHVVAVDDGISGFHVVGKGGDDLIDGSTGLDDDDNGSVPSEGGNEGCSGMILW